jgi:hypothetical protein
MKGGRRGLHQLTVLLIVWRNKGTRRRTSVRVQQAAGRLVTTRWAGWCNGITPELYPEINRSLFADIFPGFSILTGNPFLIPWHSTIHSPSNMLLRTKALTLTANGLLGEPYGPCQKFKSRTSWCSVWLSCFVFGRSQFKTRARDRISCVKGFVVFVSVSKQIPGYYFKVSHNRFLPLLSN